MPQIETYAFDVVVRFEARDRDQALRHADRIMKLLENGSPADSMRDLDIEARFVEAKNIRLTDLPARNTDPGNSNG